MRRLSILFLLFACSRELPPGAIRTVVDRSHDGHRVIFIGLDGADWRLLDRFIADGTMPNLGRIVAGSHRRTLLTQHPPLSPLVWTSMMTGVSPLDHRILDFTRFNPTTRQKEPITSDERAVPAIWNMATYGGRRAGIFGLWATAPAESVNGTIITDRDVSGSLDVQTERVRSSAIDWIHKHHPDLAIVYFQGTDEIGHLVSGDVEKARPYFRHIDEILAEFRSLAMETDADLVIASDHGFDWGGTHESSIAIATAGKWHRDEGIYIHWPGKPGAGAPAHVDQICSTLLALIGLPHDNRLAPPIDATPGDQRVDYRRYFNPNRQPTTDNRQQGEQIAKLKSLGYIAADEPDIGPANTTRTPASFNNEGLILRERGDFDGAERAFLGALAIDPQYAAAKTNLADLLIARARKIGGAEAVQLMTRAIALRDDDEARLFRGRYRLQAHDCDGALADFHAIRSETAVRYASIAAAEGCLGHDDAARRALRRSLQLDPNQPQLRELLRGH